MPFMQSWHLEAHRFPMLARVRCEKSLIVEVSFYVLELEAFFRAFCHTNIFFDMFRHPSIGQFRCLDASAWANI